MSARPPSSKPTDAPDVVKPKAPPASVVRVELSAHVREEIDHWVAKFPEGRQRSAIIGASSLNSAVCGMSPVSILRNSALKPASSARRSLLLKSPSSAKSSAARAKR